ncbi:Clp protease N-terminal domain-containing protein [Actinosynnema sp. NPDC023587]|uniref:Clp protease N-terminal domain-containing protein n=1 Tax=Actinosynnema sp. NPDC023587 TaxID=3154695 RepID=UPI0033D8C6F1
MPKINVYLSDELADAVKELGVPVSAICQRALEQSVKRVAAIRAAALGDLSGGDPTGGLSQFTDRARAAIRLGIERARADGAAMVGTGHLLHGLLAEGNNLALHVLRAMEIEPERVADQRVEPAGTSDAAGTTPADRFDGPAANALELTITEAVTLGHNYVGCEHLLLGLIAEPDGAGGQVLRAAGAELRSTRGAVVAALAGYVHLRATTAGGGASPAADIVAVLRQQLQPLVDRIERLEERLDLPAQT